MRGPTIDNVSHLPDLSAAPLDEIVRLCNPSEANLAPEDLTDRPVLREALLRVQREATQQRGFYAGFDSVLSN